jgi:hypothetical protein
MIEETLVALHNWFTEPTAGNDRPKLLSKLASLELCGWLEGWMDQFVLELSQKCLWFDYSLHLRPMLCKILGEHLTRSLEAEFDRAHPGDLAQIKSTLGSLWKIRCEFAHSDLAANVAMQSTFNAPSFTQNQHRVLNKKLEAFRAVGNKLATSAKAVCATP